jgi:hypothetical protein
MEETKVCTKCEKEQPIANFYSTIVPATDKRRAYNYTRTLCRGCTKVYSDLAYLKRKGMPVLGRKLIVPLPTREEMQEWFAAGCPLGNRRAA